MATLYTTQPIVTNDLVLCLDAANIVSYDFNYASDPINGQALYTTSGTYTFTVPAGINEISAVCVGGGGGGGGSSNAENGGGGGGGALSYGTIDVTPLEDLTVVVGGAGNAGSVVGDGGSGGDTQLKRSSTVLLQGEGGGGGEFTLSGGGEGGAGGTSTGTDRIGGGSGGAGGTGNSFGGGGGGAGGYTGNGGNGSGTTEGSAGSGGGGGGGGGTPNTSVEYRGGGVGVLGEHDPVENGNGGSTNGFPGSGGSSGIYGAGGGGSYKGHNNAPGVGYKGAVRIVYKLNDDTRVYPALANVGDTTFTMSSTSWIDITNSGNTGTIVNYPVYSSNNFGIFNFNGSSQYVECGDIISLTAYTKSVWFRPETSGANNIISGPADSHVLWMNSTNNSLQAGHQGTWNRVSYTLPSGNMLNQWWNGVVTWNNSTGWVLYLNGDQVDTDSDTTGPNNAETFIGKYSTGYYFDGDIAQVLIYDRVITAAEVLQNYNSLKGRFGL